MFTNKTSHRGLIQTRLLFFFNHSQFRKTASGLTFRKIQIKTKQLCCKLIHHTQKEKSALQRKGFSVGVIFKNHIGVGTFFLRCAGWILWNDVVVRLKCGHRVQMLRLQLDSGIRRHIKTWAMEGVPNIWSVSSRTQNIRSLNDQLKQPTFLWLRFVSPCKRNTFRHLETRNLISRCFRETYPHLLT